jgi:hypothetical protein
VTRTPDPDRLAVLLALVANNLRHEIAQHLAAHPRAAAYDSDRTTGGGGTDPTVTAALAPDPARADLAAYDAAGQAIHRNLLIWLSLSEKYLPARQPRRGKLEADTRPCHLHDRAGATTTHHHGKHRTDLGSYLAKPLPEPVHVCAPCYEQVRRIGRLPTNDELIRHDRTGKWAVRTSGKREAVWTATNIAKDWEGAQNTETTPTS